MPGETVILIHRGPTGVDGHGNEVLTETSRETIEGVPVAPGDANGAGGNEDTDGKEQVFEGLTIYPPVGPVFAAVDQVIARGVTWEVQGRPQSWVSPFTGWAPGTVVQLKRVTG